jgi:hypothetical protein
MNGWVRTAAAAATATALAVITGAIVRPFPALAALQPLGGYAAAWAVFAAGAWLVLGVAPRRAVPVILLGGIVIQLAAVTAPPSGSDDLYRYIWDGRVQAAGIDPYRYPPDSARLAFLRDPFLWPAAGPYCVGDPAPPLALTPAGSLVPAAPPAVTPPPAVPPGCTRINRPRVHTIYPPVAEAYFTVVAEAAPAGSGTLPIQAAGALCAIATAVLLAAGLARLGRDPRLAVLWAWCPVTALQAGNGAHVDVLAAFLTAAALLCLARPGSRRAVAGGLLLGLAIATKINPVLAVPAALRRRPVLASPALAVPAALRRRPMLAGPVQVGPALAGPVLAGPVQAGPALAGPALVGTAVAAATAAVYLPHLLAVGGAVIGFLPGYLAQDGYASGGRFELLSLAVPGSWATLAAVAVLAVTALAVWRRADPAQPWRGAVIMTGVALAVTTPSLLWYSTLLVLLVALDGRAEWLALAAARYLTPVHPLPGLTLPWAGQLGYAAALAVVAAVTAVRLARARAAVTSAATAQRRTLTSAIG